MSELNDIKVENEEFWWEPMDDFASEYDNDDDDIYSLGIHLINEHNCKDKSDFNNIYRVLILEVCSPNSLEVKEHKWIHRLNSLRPSGINRANPFSFLPYSSSYIHNPSVT